MIVNFFMKQEQAQTNRYQTSVCQEGGINWESGISRCELLHIEWINNKVLLYSPGNYIQYLMISHNEKEYERVPICIIESFCCTIEINTTS